MLTIPSIGTLILLLGSALMLQGLDTATGGEIYLASVRSLAQATTDSPHDTSVHDTSTMPASSVSPTPSPIPSFTPIPSPSAEFIPLASPIPQEIPSPMPQPFFSPFPSVSPLPGQEHVPQQAPPPPPPPIDRNFFPMGNPPELKDERGFGHEEGPQDFVNPQELRQVFREIRDLKSQIRQLTNRTRRSAAFTEDASRLTAIFAELDQFQSIINNAIGSGGSPRDAIQDFRDNQYWDQLNKIRAKVELPMEIKQIEQSVRRLERLIKVKSVKNLGLNIDTVQGKLNEMKQQITEVQGHITAGNLEEAMEAMRLFHENGHPGEIEGTIFRIRDIKQMIRRVRDEQIRMEVDRVLQRVIDTFNAGEYRDARETLDEYADDLQRLIRRFLNTRTFKGKSRDESFSNIRNLEQLMRTKLQEDDSRGQQQ